MKTKIFFKKFTLIVPFILLSIFFYSNAYAQCDITNFTATPVNGACIADGSVVVAVTDGSACAGTTATIRLAGSTTDLAFIFLNNTGNGQFNNLAPGNYEVRLQQGAITSSPKSITISSSYAPLSVTATGNNTSCATADPLFTNNGKATVSFTGGIGSYTITLTGPGGPYIFNTATPTSHTFTGLAPGNYTATVTDNSGTCTSSEARSITIEQTLSASFFLQYSSRLVNDNCDPYFAFYFNGGNVANTLLPGNATYTIAGDPTVYNLIHVPELGGAYAFRTEYDLPDNSIVTFTASNGCKTVTGTRNSGVILQNQLNLFDHRIETNLNTCEKFYRVSFITRRAFGGADVWDYSPGAKASFYQETPANSDNWVLQSTYADAPLWIYLNNMSFTSSNINTRYKIVVEDANGCNSAERIIDARLAPTPAVNITLTENLSILQGTSSINISGASLVPGTVVSIDRVDGQSSMTINPTQPFNLAGSYTINFPVVRTYTGAAAVNFRLGDLPLGQYTVSVTLPCNQTIVRTITLTQPAAYNPSVQIITGCLSSNIVFNMGQNNRVANSSRSRLRLNNAGALGAIVRDVTENPLQQLSGQFINVPPGEYFLEFPDPRYGVWNFSDLNFSLDWSVARNMPGGPQPYHTPITILPYKQMSFTTTQVFCDNTNPNSGILAITASGIPIDFIKYEVWQAGADPSVDPPLYSYNTTTLTELTHVFSGLTEGNYLIRVSGACGFTQQNVILARGGAVPNPIASRSAICPGQTSTLSIPIPSTMYNISWFNGNGDPIGTGNSITVSPTSTEIFRVTYALNSNFGCSSPINGFANLQIDVLSIPNVPIIATATSCSSAGTATVSNYLPGNTYVFLPAGPTVGAGGVISGMTVGTNYTVTASNGSCSSVASLSFSIDAMLPTPAAPTVSTTMASCSAAGTATISNYVSTQSYTFLPAGPTIGAGGVISGMAAGTAYTVTANNGSCTSVASTSFSIGAMLPTPVAPTVNTTMATCAETGTATVSNYLPGNTYVFLPAGPTVGAGGVISGMTVGTNYTVTASNGSCTSVASLSFSIDAMLPTPAAPTVSTTMASCSAAGTATISNYVSTQSYTFLPAGPTVGAGGVISGMAAGTGYTVTANNGSCTSAASASFSIGAMLPTPVAPTVNTTMATCSAAGTATISNYVSTNTYTFLPAGPSIGAGGLINGITAGTAYTVMANNGSCTSVASTSFSIGAMLPTPVAPMVNTTMATCSAAGTATISNYVSTNTYTFLPAGPSVGAGGLISGMAAGTVYTVTTNNGSCTSAASASFSIGAILPTPATPTIATTLASCASAGTATISNYVSNNTYTFLPAGPTVGAGGVISGMAAGTAYTVTANNGSCTSVASTSFSIGAMLPTPVATIAYNATQYLASGTANVIQTGQTGGVYTASPAGLSINATTGTINLAESTPGQDYTITYTFSNGTCSASVSTKLKIGIFKIPNVITPDGDGLNDSFKILGIEFFPENNMSIFNRWGNEVFHSNGAYKQNWTGEGLNTGTYYYLFKVREENGEWKVYKGAITLLR